MNAHNTAYVLRYDSLYNAGRWFSFPCDQNGAIDIDALPPRARSSYLATRALVGLEFAFPVVERTHAS
jgi:hypothetical protein